MLYSGNKGMSPAFEQSSKKKKKQLDRFIPHSVSKNLYPLFEQSESNGKKNTGYSNILGQNLFTSNSTGKVLHFTNDSTQKNKQNYVNYNNIENNRGNSKKRNPLKNQPFKKWEAPLLKDDFYLNLVDWSDNDNIGVGLDTSLCVRSGCFSKVARIYESFDPSDYICSVSFLKDSQKICSGFPDGRVKIFDTTKSLLSQEYDGLHFGRVGSLGCTSNLICTGGRDGYVSIQDIRTESEVMRYKAHNQEICGLKICPNGQLIATGGNDNKLFVFSMRKMSKLASWSQHRAAVKAIGFNPKQPTIASGGGTADRKIRIFSLQTLQLMNEIDTGSQVCNLLYSPVSNELVTTHGYSLNQINLWKWGNNGSLEKTESLMGHRSRVLYLAGQSAGGKIITGAGGDQLRLWKLFEENQFSIPYDLR